ncbi:MAG: MBG domain-containing protein [Verrucomicrobiota bacterium]
MKKILLGLLGLANGAMTLLAQPVITQPPTNQVLAVGGTLALSVTVSGTSPVYQWFKDSRFLVNATNSTLTVANAGVTNSGTYYVVVTNGGGLVISQPALVMVGNPVLADWGNNSYGQLGNGTTNNISLPVMVANNVVAGGAGLYHSMFVKMDGTIWAMGLNNFGQLGNGTTNNTSLPVCVASNAVTASAGGYHSLFVKTNGTLWAMGSDLNGQLGDGQSANFRIKLPVSVASNVVAVAAGYMHSLFIKTNGTLWAMGDDTYGQLGNGSYNGTFSPICVASNVVAVVAGADHSLFVKTNGTLWAMGNNSNGQLGNGTTSSTNRPTCVASNVVAVGAGYGYSMFTKTNGTLWAMGWNYYGALGNGTVNNATLPVQVTNASSVAIVFPGERAYHAMAIGNIHSLATVTLTNLTQTYDGTAKSAGGITIPGGLAVSLTYNGSPNAPTDPGSYTVIVTINDPNAYGSVTNTMMLGLRPQNFLASCTNVQKLTLQLSGTPNYPYILQAATNLTPPIDWKPVLTNPADVNGNWSIIVSNLTGTNRFYRAASQ